MKIIEAVWEKRNLGLDVLEIELEASDCPQDVTEQLKDLTGADYVSVKIPTGALQLTQAVEEIGFRFREMLSSVEVVKLPELDRIMMRYARHMSSSISTQDETAQILSHIRAGMFTTDRFSLDPAFSAQQSANRYCGWIEDEIARGAELHSIVFKEKFVGFFLVRSAGEGRFYSLLAGIFPEFQDMGLGYFINHMAYVHCFENGAKTVATTFSSNNLGASNIHNIISTRLTSQCYVFSKHLK